MRAKKPKHRNRPQRSRPANHAVGAEVRVERVAKITRNAFVTVANADGWRRV